MAKGVVFTDFDLKEIRERFKAKKESTEEAIISHFCYVGEMAVNTARNLSPDEGSYHDRTGNLRSSIGYVVLNNGKAVKRGRPQAKAGPDGSGAEGEQEGEKFLQKLMGEYPKGIVLIVVAGMNYAVYVEALYHKDVLTSAELAAERAVNNLLNMLFDRR